MFLFFNHPAPPYFVTLTLHVVFFFFNDSATTEIYTPSLHDALPILQWILTHSHSAKMLAVQRVTTNKGRNTPGVDNKVWRSDRQKLVAISLLKQRGYKPQPLRRI